ncbi:energy transducer TonB [Neokomagataea anthophila]|uniref:Energy transducer TonB n=1 Tax=Neokomagataea anthophila TaxID=2826925 RepID=A0ABS5E967_9PROT|nr:energy transducer TonB [Neokomagataea anthophila]MBR0560445.1 energy transducer TonB [Neokomagataea anthophila]
MFNRKENLSVNLTHLYWVREAKRKLWRNAFYAALCLICLFFLFFYFGKFNQNYIEGNHKERSIMVVSSYSYIFEKKDTENPFRPKMISIENTNFIIPIPNIKNNNSIKHPMHKPMNEKKESSKVSVPLENFRSPPKISRAVATKKNEWQKLIMERFNNFRLYPNEARINHDEGTTVLCLSIDRNGNLLKVMIDQTSGSSILDDEALHLAYRVAPLYPPPESVVGDPVVIMIPVDFQLDNN